MLRTLLTPCEFNVLSILALGYTNKQIAAKLFVSESTVKAQVQSMFEKLKVTNRVQAAVLAAKFLNISLEDIMVAVHEIQSEKY